VGFLAAAACPLRWRGDVIGAINVFLPRARALSDDEQRVVQAFADVAAIAIIHAGLPPVQDLARITRRALAARTVVEQAKGVIADQTGLDMAAAFDRLRALADQRGQPLEAIAQDLVNSTTRPAP
jgi:GAF domain-containing protein